MTVILNGKPVTPTTATSVAELVAELQLAAPTLLIEHNGTALTRSEWPTTPLANQDTLEILKVTAGG